jgi:hypothetical protein
MDSTSKQQCMLCGSTFNLPQLSSCSSEARLSLALLDKVTAISGTEVSESEDSESEDSESEDSEDLEKSSRFRIHSYCWSLFECLDLSKESLLQSSKAMWDSPSTSFFSPTIRDLAVGCRMALTSHATNSRDASEGRQEVYNAEDDSRSTSDSIKPRRRDMTPLTAGLDANGAELVSDRNKRKLADIEKTLDKQPPKKKKRGSDGPLPATPLFAIIASFSQISELLEEVLKYVPDCYFRSTIAVLAFSTILGPAPKDSIRTIQISTTMSPCTMGAYLTDLQSDDTEDIPNVSAVEFQMGTHGICAIRFHVKCDDECSNTGEKIRNWIGGNASSQHEIWTGLIKNQFCRPARNLSIKGDVSQISYSYEH